MPPPAPFAFPPSVQESSPAQRVARPALARPTDAMPRGLLVPTRGVQRVETLPALLSDFTLLMTRHPRQHDLAGVLAWGRKPSARAAETVAARLGLPVWRVEDGFLRSLGLGHQEPPLSLVLDDLGIYYDATAPSRLEHQVAGPHDDAQRARALALRQRWCDGRLSKYNHAREPRAPEEPCVLVVDQTAGDASIGFGMADAGAFRRMLEAALDEHPGVPVLLKVHPDVVAGRKRGHFDHLTPGQAERIQVLASAAHPCGLLQAARAVYVVTSQLGFEALLWGRRVRCFGMPFYAGWGLTGDELAQPGRRQAVTLEDLVHGALVAYPRYLDPETGLRCAPERLVDWLALQRRMRARFAPEVHALGFSRWKKPIVRAFFGGSAVTFVRGPEQVPAGATLALWGRRTVDLPAPGGHRIVRLEDGFLRSVGLGADLVRPLSWVMDTEGMYYDAATPSALERLLGDARFDAALLQRARALRERIVAEGITKYNVGGASWRRPADGRPVLLVPGQVESDAAIAHGAPGLRTNLGLLQAVREANPGAHVVYKPHPDVVARLRSAGRGEDEAVRHCDELVVDVPMGVLLGEVDEVHVLTSLAGFEALLRGRRVVVYGCPFYAGWGLTEDRLTMPRRQRRLALDELVAGVLVLYPTYVSRTTARFTTPERALDELVAWRQRGASTLPWWRKLLRFGLGMRRR